MYHCVKEQRCDETISKTFYHHETHKVLMFMLKYSEQVNASHVL